MRLLLLGKLGSITHWLEEAAGAFRAEGHDVRIGVVRDSRLHLALQLALEATIAERIAIRAVSFRPDLVLAVGGFHVPLAVLERLAGRLVRPPLVGWVGDAFGEEARAIASLYDLAAYTDTGLVRRHTELGFAAPTVFAPHAVDPRRAAPAAARVERMVFVANPTPGRRAVVEAIARPIALYGPGWPAGGGHKVHARRLPARALSGVYARHLASLNVRNEFNVLSGLNQRNFQPCLTATPLVTDDQPDLTLCFQPGAEALVWRDAAELNDLYARLLAAPDEAVRVGAAGRARVLAEHTYGRRLRLLAGLIGGGSA